MWTAIQSVLAIIVVLALGFWAGKRNIISGNTSATLSSIVMLFTFPAALFTSMAGTKVADLVHLKFLGVFFLGLMLLFFVLIVAGRMFFKWDARQSAMFAFACTFPNMAFMGIPYLSEELGAQSLLSVAIGNVITSVFMIPAVIYFMESSNGAATGNVFVKSMLNVFKKPLVIAPILGVVVALSGLHLPHFFIKGLELLGSGTSPIALFALGLMMTRFKFKFSLTASYIMLLKLLIQPLITVAFVYSIGLHALDAREVIILTAMPTAVIVSMFAEKYQCLQEETVSAIIGGNFLSIVTLVLFTVWSATF